MILVIIENILLLLKLAIFISILQGWTGFMAHHPFSLKLDKFLEGLYYPIRQFTNHIPGIFDFAPMIALIIIFLLEDLLRMII